MHVWSGQSTSLSRNTPNYKPSTYFFRPKARCWPLNWCPHTRRKLLLNRCRLFFPSPLPMTVFQSAFLICPFDSLLRGVSPFLFLGLFVVWQYRTKPPACLRGWDVIPASTATLLPAVCFRISTGLCLTSRSSFRDVLSTCTLISFRREKQSQALSQASSRITVAEVTRRLLRSRKPFLQCLRKYLICSQLEKKKTILEH